MPSPYPNQTNLGEARAAELEQALQEAAAELGEAEEAREAAEAALRAEHARQASPTAPPPDAASVASDAAAPGKDGGGDEANGGDEGERKVSARM